LLELAGAYGLIATGGSDFHGPCVERGGALGSVGASPGCVEQLQEAAASATKQGAPREGSDVRETGTD
jgi:hypothetical protein